ncbi:Glycoside hydrolase [Mycena indigotica]|uniref:Glycoside hydrolase n=1 Tax=Mycena indigotica TaxID=2126181 RepID=A0A8H6S0K4_9AGAR|nr:Glycoside hydrolase [Mycena indigotica]KAF7290704.1 Glycoside hydrolase [Mycena indigotica]
MRATSLFTQSLRLLPLIAPAVFAAHGLPDKIYGVNLGSWLLVEPWMLPQEWKDMGGESCSDCSQCIASEGAFAEAYPKTVDATFAKHWETWFTQADVDKLKAAGINTVRIPLGYWLVEALVDRKNGEYFPKGGLKHLRRGLAQLKKAGIVAILDHHGLPGAQDPGQQFTGRCTPWPQFYTSRNYHRALVWTAVMTSITHQDADFSNVVALEAVNEPVMEAAKTPGYGDFSKNFVRVVRAVEFLLRMGIPSNGNLKTAALPAQNTLTGNFTADLPSISDVSEIFTPEVRAAVLESVPILLGMGYLGLFVNGRKEPLITNFMDVSWQWGSSVSNPADAAIGPQIYDNHLYYVFGGVADANPEAYMKHICNLDRVENDAAKGNSPLYFGEWGLPTQFEATDEFLKKWADAQKLAYSKGAGWVFWNFKIEKSTLAGDLAREWSYLEGLERGYFTQDPSQLHDPHVCDPYLPGASTSALPSSTAAAPSQSAIESAQPSSVPQSSAAPSTSTPAPVLSRRSSPVDSPVLARRSSPVDSPLLAHRSSLVHSRVLARRSSPVN